MIEVKNMMASGTVGRSVNLTAIVRACPEAEYRPKGFQKFHCALFRFRDHITVLIFATGKVICSGAKSEKEIEKAIDNVMMRLRKSGLLINRPKMSVQNITVSADLGKAIDIPLLFEAERDNRAKMIYEPEQFPALIYYVKQPKATILAFSSGKLICIGAKKVEDAYKAISLFCRKLEKPRFANCSFRAEDKRGG